MQKGKPAARVIYLPDAKDTPEKLVDDLLVTARCEIVIPALISRDTEFSVNERLGIRMNIPHREWVYRQCFELGRHIIGYEVQKALSVVDWFAAQPEQLPVLIAGLGEGGMIAMHAAAIDTRIDAAYVSGYFGPRKGVWEEPIYRNVFGLLRDFGDAEVASLIAPRPLAVHHFGFPRVAKPPGNRNQAAPGKLTTPNLDESKAEVDRARMLVPGDWIQFYTEQHGLTEIVTQVLQKGDRQPDPEVRKHGR